MISADTTITFLRDFNKNVGDDPDFMLRSISEFTQSEPNIVAFITMLLMGSSIQNPASAALIALAFYQSMRESQEKADKLKKDVSG